MRAVQLLLSRPRLLFDKKSSEKAEGMPIVIPDLDAETSRERIRLLIASIKELEGDIETYRRITISIQKRRDSLSKSAELEKLGWCNLLCVIPSCLRPKWSKHTATLLSSDRELNDAEGKLWRLRRERDELERILRMYEAAFAPVSTLPVEILQTIFLRALPSKFPTPNRSQVPINLTMVCHKWRTLALATPALWTSMSTSSDWPLCAFSPVPVKTDSHRLNDVLSNQSLSMRRSNQPNLWIHRAQGLPFHMEIIIPHNDRWFGRQDPYRTWVLQTSNQWSHLRIQSRAVGMSTLLACPLPKLQTLELVGTIQDHPYTSYSCYADFSLGTAYFQSSWKWSSLTTLDASSTWFLLQQLPPIFEQAPVLRDFRAKVLDLGNGPVTMRPRITHTNLVTLEIKFRCERVFKCLIDYFTLPSLTSLYFCYMHPHAQFRWSDNDMIAFAQRSHCPLETFHARGLWKDEQVAVSAVRAMQLAFPTLRDVDLSII